jgi:UDP-GlcNAc:undecaprenyl-phosphate GlcNAc-1-phosphate transferase
MSMPLIVVSLMLVSLAISVTLCLVMLHISRRYGLLDRATGQIHKRHTLAIPNTGGVAIFWAITIPLASALLAVWLTPWGWVERWLPVQELLLHVPGLQQTTAIGGVIIVGVSLVHLLGLLDDRRPLGPYVKLFYQSVVAFMLVTLGDIRVLQWMDQLGWWGLGLSIAASMAWIVVIVNAMNFLDNMDGLTAGVGATIATLYLGATLIGGQWFVAAMAALLLGALLGFLLFNFPPARMYMGDGGSLVVGLMLAVISVRTTYFDTTPLTGAGGVGAVPHQPGAWYAVLMPLMVMAVPLYDFCSVTIIRTLRGQSPFVGDQNHFSHRLVRKGLSKRRAVVVIWMCTLATGLSGVMLGSLQAWQALLAAGQTVAILAVLATLERGTPTS